MWEGEINGVVMQSYGRSNAFKLREMEGNDGS